ncbi:hypothetical protein M5K25_005994 [Dendrobium thyrsiflorum]|uniref:Uncharacterized protein n=1 Tax=Dendrobium thyrsiflorum TaxID=117978 RepID=A0ABD0VAD7_DENTH
MEDESCLGFWSSGRVSVRALEGISRSYFSDESGSSIEELPAIRPYLGLLDPAFYTHSSFRLEPREICFPMLIFLKFTCSICDAMSGSDSSPSGKYRSSSELQSIGNTIMQASGASFLTYFSLTGVLGTAEITRHTSVGRGFASPSSSVSPILSSNIKSASLMGCLTNFDFPGLEELAWLRCCLEVDACTLGNPFRLSTGSSSWRPQSPIVLPELGGERSITSSHCLSRAFSSALKISWFIVSTEYQFRLGLRNFSVFGSHLSPHLSSDVGECDIFIIRMILFDFICFLFSLRTITSIGDGASLVNRISERRRHWISGSLFGRRISSTRGLRSKLTSSFGGVGERRDPLEDSPRRRHESSFGPISDVLDCWGRISGKPHRMSRLNLFLFLSFLHLYEALASRFACLSTGTFRRWIPEPGVQVSHPDAHRAGCALRADVSAEWGLLAGLSKSVPYAEVAAVLATTAGKSTLPNWIVAPELPVLITAFAKSIMAPCPSWTVIGVFCSSICTNER